MLSCEHIYLKYCEELGTTDTQLKASQGSEISFLATTAIGGLLS